MRTIGSRTPPPPIELDHTRHSSAGFVFVMIVLLAGITPFALIAASKVAEREAKREEFLAKCIGFHTLDHCRDIYHYGRQDLLEVRR